MTDNISDFNQKFNQPTQEHQEKEKTQKKALEFFGKSQNCVVCFVDIVESTKLTAHIPESKLSIFYSTFLNNMADIVEEHNGKIVKSIGDALLFYFEVSGDYLRNSLMCGLDMINKRDKINNELKQ